MDIPLDLLQRWSARHMALPNFRLRGWQSLQICFQLEYRSSYYRNDIIWPDRKKTWHWRPILANKLYGTILDHCKLVDNAKRLCQNVKMGRPSLHVGVKWDPTKGFSTTSLRKFEIQNWQDRQMLSQRDRRQTTQWQDGDKRTRKSILMNSQVGKSETSLG